MKLPTLACVLSIALAGCTGTKGEPGAAGANGSDGTTGAPGDKGSPGDKGDRGDRGDPGPVGEAGAPGAPGEAGAPGPQGDAGPAGPAGDAGPAGPSGDAGPPGPGGVVWKDAAGKRLPVFGTVVQLFFFDANGDVWVVSPGTLTVQPLVVNPFELQYQSANCSGSPYVVYSIAPESVGARVTFPMPDGSFRARNDASPITKLTTCSRQGASGCEPIACGPQFATLQTDTHLAVPPDLSVYTAPAHPELVP